jgi:hypothetical protein
MPREAKYQFALPLVAPFEPEFDFFMKNAIITMAIWKNFIMISMVYSVAAESRGTCSQGCRR